MAKRNEVVAEVKAVASIVDVSTVGEALALFTQAIAGSEKATAKASEYTKQAAEKLVALGYKPEVNEKGKAVVPVAIAAHVDAAIQKGFLMGGRWSKAEYALVVNGAEAAKATGQGKARSALTTCMPQYRLRLAERMLEACPELLAQSKQAKEQAKAAKDAQAGKASGVAESEGQGDGAPAAMAGICPGNDREQYMAAINLMIVATRNLASTDKLVKKNADAICAAYAEILRELGGN